MCKISSVKASQTDELSHRHLSPVELILRTRGLSTPSSGDLLNYELFLEIDQLTRRPHTVLYKPARES